MPSSTALQKFERRLVASEHLQGILWDSSPHRCNKTAELAFVVPSSLKWRDDDPHFPLCPGFLLTDEEEEEHLGFVWGWETEMNIFGEEA